MARVDLEGMDDMYNCERTWRKESLNMTTGELIVEGMMTSYVYIDCLMLGNLC